jgi:hypothetical protein
MSIYSVIRRCCTQSAVYWATPVENKFGGQTYTSPVEVKCRWEKKNVVIASTTGEQIISRTTVYVLQDMVEGEYLYLGALAGLSTAQRANPKLVVGAYKIKRFNKIPDFKGTDYTRSCNLDEWNE